MSRKGKPGSKQLGWLTSKATCSHIPRWQSVFVHVHAAKICLHPFVSDFSHSCRSVKNACNQSEQRSTWGHLTSSLCQRRRGNEVRCLQTHGLSFPHTALVSFSSCTSFKVPMSTDRNQRNHRNFHAFITFPRLKSRLMPPAPRVWTSRDASFAAIFVRSTKKWKECRSTKKWKECRCMYAYIMILMMHIYIEYYWIVLRPRVNTIDTVFRRRL